MSLLARWLAALLFTALLAGCAGPRIEKPTTWQSLLWRGEPAWSSDSGDWRAVVSIERARLIYLGPRDGEANLLYAPPLPQEYHLPRGGHLFWLGPQSEWNAKWGVWPPPLEWEHLPAASVQADGARLSLTLPRPDLIRPQLRRSYRWRGGTLFCETAWSGGAGDYQAIQILELPLGATVTARRLAENAPGFVRFDMTKGNTSLEPTVLGAETTLSPAGTVLLAAGATSAKFGFLPHTLDARVGDYGLELGRGELRGVALGSPDGGFDTQVFLGNAAGPNPFVEIEQLTSRLKNRGARENSFTILVKPRRLSHPGEASASTSD